MLGVLIVLAGVVFYLMKQPTPQDTANKEKNPQILTFATTDATKIVITGGEKSTEIDKSGSTWQLVKPIQTPADAGRVEGWLDQLGTLSAERVIDGASDVAQYGLSEPKLNVEVSLAAGKTAKISLGDKTPDGSDYYAQVSDDKKVYLVSAPLGDDLNSALTNPPKALPTPTALPTLVPTTPGAGLPGAIGTPGATTTPAG